MGKGNRTRNSKYQDAYDMSGSGAAVKNTKGARKKDHTSTILLITIIALIAISLVLVIFADTGIKDRNTVIVSSDNYKVTGAMMPYFENLAYTNEFYYYYQLFASYLGDANTALQYAQSQVQGRDFFNTALTSVKEILVLCEAAKAEGIALEAEDKTTIDETLASFGGNFKGLGKGVKANDVRLALELEVLAGKYYDKYHEEKAEAVTDEDIKKYIEEHKADFYVANHLMFDITLEADDYTDNEDAFEAAKQLADKYLELIAGAKTEKEFKNQVIRYIADRDFDTQVTKLVATDVMPDEATLSTLKQDVVADLVAALVEDTKAEKPGTDAAEIDKEMYEVFEALQTTCTTALNNLAGSQAYVEEPATDAIKWLINKDTVVLSTKKVDNSTDEKYSFAVYMLTETLHVDDEETVNVGHILVEAREGTATDAEIEAASKEAREILDTYLAGEKTREAFEKLGEEKTDDSSVFYENVKKGDMVTAFDAWIFGENRTEGETAIVQTEFGYHVMYWDGKGDNTSIAAAKSGIVGDLYQAFVEEGAKSLKINERQVEKHAETETEAAA